jgi:hypothetical protein
MNHCCTADACRRTRGGLSVGNDRLGWIALKILAALGEFSEGDENVENAVLLLRTVLLAAIWEQ